MTRQPKTGIASSRSPLSPNPGGTGTEPNGAPASRKPAPSLYLVATPIGNLRDLTIRARDTLASVDVIACEDTRVTRRLLAAYAIETPMTAYHEHNAAKVRPRLIERLKRGESVALLSDAGTPLVSDPGYKLVRAAVDEGLPITALPGPSAVLSALLLSGLPCDRFLFAGFLPPKSAARKAALTELATLKATLIFFESPRRLAGSLTDMAAVLGDRPAAVARELTKRFEEVVRQPLTRLAEHYHRTGSPKGEVVVVVAPAGHAGPALEDAEVDTLLRRALAKSGTRDAAAEVAARTGLSRRKLYERAIALKSGERPDDDD
jgi:16S rRNA (cytidine1402-2'-O)-methyltransferase